MRPLAPLPGFSADQRQLALGDLLAGPNGLAESALDGDAIRALHLVVAKIAGITTHTGGRSTYGAATGVVGVLKSCLGGKWPDATLHTRQQLECWKAAPIDEVLASTCAVELIEPRGRFAKVLLLTTTQAGGELLARHRTTMYWPADSAGERRGD